ncbi:hypothetical protein ALI144C_04475 [Actinosynnema sp. ALI-1.44]|uniref:hypothetical protein n=1 Tax=Actinosynnema sp. ALI-1.44 TaxID=1933779 RepID=UPI00097C6BAB|nr:hypothetical protein [Actinosynnema sp. ALI-1.44]ONI89602.1 hypothetical protein ALI144C_04475 [Actinosynnema sp. ALI-1.44]
MNMRKLAATAVASVGVSLLISGTAYADHVEYKGPYETPDECVQALRNLPHDPTVNGMECIPMNGKHYIEISHTN